MSLRALALRRRVHPAQASAAAYENVDHRLGAAVSGSSHADRYSYSPLDNTDCTSLVDSVCGMHSPYRGRGVADGHAVRRARGVPARVGHRWLRPGVARSVGKSTERNAEMTAYTVNCSILLTDLPLLDRRARPETRASRRRVLVAVRTPRRRRTPMSPPSSEPSRTRVSS